MATPGPATLSVAAIGRVAAGRAVLRSGAQAGDSSMSRARSAMRRLGVLAAKGQDLGVGAARAALS